MGDAQDQAQSRPKFHIAIIGAGMGGLSLAILLAQAGHRVTAIERKAGFDTLSDGGGINVTNNAIVVLESTGIGKEFQRISDPVTHIVVKRYANAEVINESDTTRPHVMLHRHDLQLVLYKRALEIGIDVQFGKRLSSLDLAQASPVVTFEDGTTLIADLVVGADGVNSKVRRSLFPDREVGATPTADCVFLVDVPEAVMRASRITQGFCDLPPYSIALGPGRSVVGWYMSNRNVYHLQVCDHEFDQGKAYGCIAGEPYIKRFDNMGPFRERWSDFDESLRTILSNVESCVKWRIATAPRLPSWTAHDGRVLLLGDAAHAFPPWAGQGACMAFEDAGCLGTLINHARSLEDMNEVGKIYEKLRRPRVEKLHDIVLANVAMFSLPDGEQQRARDEGLRAAAAAAAAAATDSAPAKREQAAAGEEKDWGQGIGNRGTSETYSSIEDYNAMEEAHHEWEMRGRD